MLCRLCATGLIETASNCKSCDPEPFYVNELPHWSERSRQRAALRNLADDQHLLDDLGLTRQQLMDEANKPFRR